MRRRELEIKARTRPAGNSKGNGGKGEHEGKGGGVGRKGTQQVENLEMDQKGQRGRVASNVVAGGSHPQAMSVPERRETRRMRWADCENDESRKKRDNKTQRKRQRKRSGKRS